VSVTTPSGRNGLPSANLADRYTKADSTSLGADAAKTTITVSPFDEKAKSDFKWFVYRDSNLNGTPIKLVDVLSPG